MNLLWTHKKVDIYDIYIKAHKYKRKDLLDDIKDKRNDYKLVFNMTHHPNFSNLKVTMLFLHLSYTLDLEHQNFIRF